MKTVYFIPTHRNCGAAIRSYSKELLWAHTEGHSIPLVVVETNRGPHVSANAMALRDISIACPELTVVHLTLDRQEACLREIFSGRLSHWLPLFTSGDHDYGTAMNKLFIFTYAMGAQGFHRRDSDTVLAEDQIEAATGRYPLKAELEYLGAPLSCLTGVSDARHSLLGGSITVVGGNYVGEWNLDVHELMRAGDYPLVESLYCALGFPEQDVPGMVRTAFPKEVIFDHDVRTTLVTSVNDGLNPDCGNVAVSELGRWLPVLPGHNILAADYFAFDTATSLGMPSVHHTNAVFHQYGAERRDPAQIQTYWEGVARFADYFDCYSPLYQGYLHSELGVDVGTLPMCLASRRNLSSMIRDFAQSRMKERIDRIRKIELDILGQCSEEYHAIGQHIADHAEDLVKECSRAFALHADLFDDWPEVIRNAERWHCNASQSSR